MRNRRGIDRAGKTRENKTYIKYVNPLHPLQQGKKPNARDYLREINNECHYAIGYNVDWHIGWIMRVLTNMRFRNIIQQTDRASRWLANEYYKTTHR